MVKALNDQIFKSQFERAKQRGEERSRNEVRARLASFDRNANKIIVELINGVTFTLPCDLLREFEGADPDLIAQVELSPTGNSLHWSKLDIDFRIGAVISDLFGKDILAERGRVGGSVTSEAKKIAARENGTGNHYRRTNETSRRSSARSR